MHVHIKIIKKTNVISYYVQEAAINMWLNAGLPGKKLVVGIPSHGNTYQISNGWHTIGGPAIGAGAKGTWTQKEGMLSYYEVTYNILQQCSILEFRIQNYFNLLRAKKSLIPK